MNENFKKLLDVFMNFYLDEIFIYDKTWKDELDHIRDVLEITLRENFFFKQSRCVFVVPEVHYVGHTISKSCISANKTIEVMEWPIT